MIGLFLPSNTIEGSVDFYPSPQFLEAGKFKLSRKTRVSMEQTGRQSYESFYEYLQNSEMSGINFAQMSFSAIATVCGQSADQSK